ncbi:MAG: hypothetical protein HYV04_21530, partial [Deltaproteobacteria bacterium]|nr:hypothetical protein [Deltaproteobacteria bacterium]
MRIRITGRIVDGEPRFGRVEALFEFIVTGETLLGMEFFERLGARIVMDCRGGRVEVSGQI